MVEWPPAILHCCRLDPKTEPPHHPYLTAHIASSYASSHARLQSQSKHPRRSHSFSTECPSTLTDEAATSKRERCARWSPCCFGADCGMDNSACVLSSSDACLLCLLSRAFPHQPKRHPIHVARSLYCSRFSLNHLCDLLHGTPSFALPSFKFLYLVSHDAAAECT